LLLVFGSVKAQQITPLDSLYSYNTLGPELRVVLKPIQWWQHLSYQSDAMNCQFYHSCSNFMVDAILEKGVLKGAIIGTDRIVRCNPAARHYHLQIPDSRIQYDGRLIEPLDWTVANQPEKSPALAVSLSLIPGLGRIYAGHPVDGFLSLLLVASFAYNTYAHDKAGNPIRASLNAGLMTLFWAADIYGAYRTAKMTPDIHSP